MAAMNSSVLACNYAVSAAGSADLNSKLASMPSVVSPVVSNRTMPVIRAQQITEKESRGVEGRRAAVLGLAAALFATAASSAKAGIIDEYLEKSKVNKVGFVSICKGN